MRMRFRGRFHVVTWALAALYSATSASPHRHQTLADLVGGEYAASGEARAITSHSPFSSESHCHRVVRYADDGCLACHGQRAAALLPAGPAARESFALALAAASPESAATAFLTVGLGPRAPPALL